MRDSSGWPRGRPGPSAFHQAEGTPQPRSRRGERAPAVAGSAGGCSGGASVIGGISVGTGAADAKLGATSSQLPRRNTETMTSPPRTILSIPCATICDASSTRQPKVPGRVCNAPSADRTLKVGVPDYSLRGEVATPLPAMELLYSTR